MTEQPSRPPRRQMRIDSTALKLLISTATLGVTLTGWAALGALEAGPADVQDEPTAWQSPAPLGAPDLALSLAPLPTLVAPPPGQPAPVAPPPSSARSAPNKPAQVAPAPAVVAPPRPVARTRSSR